MKYTRSNLTKQLLPTIDVKIKYLLLLKIIIYLFKASLPWSFF